MSIFTSISVSIWHRQRFDLGQGQSIVLQEPSVVAIAAQRRKDRGGGRGGSDHVGPRTPDTREVARPCAMASSPITW